MIYLAAPRKLPDKFRKASAPSTFQLAQDICLARNIGDEKNKYQAWLNNHKTDLKHNEGWISTSSILKLVLHTNLYSLQGNSLQQQRTPKACFCLKEVNSIFNTYSLEVLISYT